MNVRNLMAVLLVLRTSLAAAQTTPAQLYTLMSGSQLGDDCPICGRPTIFVPLTGTFTLQIADQTPLATRYQLQNISFRAASGPPYQVSGSGIYEVGGEVAVTQQMFLNTEITNGFSSVNALCMSSTNAVTQPWPGIQIQLTQTNGTPGQVYHLTLVAAPAPPVRSITPDSHTGDLRLDWDGNGAAIQIERATNVTGPYSPLNSTTTNSFFIDPGILTNSSRSFYRLRPL